MIALGVRAQPLVNVAARRQFHAISSRTVKSSRFSDAYRRQQIPFVGLWPPTLSSAVTETTHDLIPSSSAFHTTASAQAVANIYQKWKWTPYPFSIGGKSQRNNFAAFRKSKFPIRRLYRIPGSYEGQTNGPGVGLKGASAFSFFEHLTYKRRTLPETRDRGRVWPGRPYSTFTAFNTNSIVGQPRPLSRIIHSKLGLCRRHLLLSSLVGLDVAAKNSVMQSMQKLFARSWSKFSASLRRPAGDGGRKEGNRGNGGGSTTVMRATLAVAASLLVFQKQQKAAAVAAKANAGKDSDSGSTLSMETGVTDRELELIFCTLFPSFPVDAALADDDSDNSVSSGKSSSSASTGAGHSNSSEQQPSFSSSLSSSKVANCFGVDASSQLPQWEQMTGTDAWSLWKRYIPELHQTEYKIVGEFSDITPYQYFQSQLDYNYRKEWDDLTIDIAKIADDSATNSEILQWVSKYPFPLNAREYVFARRAVIDDKRKVMMIVQKACDMPDGAVGLKDKPKTVRVPNYAQVLVIKPRGEFNEKGCEFMLTYVDDFGCPIPQAAINYMVKSGIPSFIDKLNSVARAMPDVKSFTIANDSFDDAAAGGPSSPASAALIGSYHTGGYALYMPLPATAAGVGGLVGLHSVSFGGRLRSAAAHLPTTSGAIIITQPTTLSDFRKMFRVPTLPHARTDFTVADIRAAQFSKFKKFLHDHVFRHRFLTKQSTFTDDQLSMISCS